MKMRVLTEQEKKKGQTKQRVIWNFSSSSSLVLPKSYSGDLFSKAFNASSLHQVWKTYTQTMT